MKYIILIISVAYILRQVVFCQLPLPPEYNSFLTGFINKKGQIEKYPSAEDSNNFLLYIGDKVWKSKEGLLYKNKLIVQSSNFINYHNSHEGLIALEDKNTKKWGYINVSGKWVILPEYDIVGDFYCNRALFVKGSKRGYIDKKGYVAFLVENSIYNDSSFNDNLVRFTTIDNGNVKYGYLNKTGDIVISPIYDFATNFYNNHACVAKDGKYYFINQNQTIKSILPENIIGISEKYSCGFVKTRSKSGKYGFIDKDGKEIAPKYDYADDFYEGFAVVVDEYFFALVDAKMFNESTSLHKVINVSGDVVFKITKEMVTEYGYMRFFGHFNDGLLAIGVSPNIELRNMTLQRELFYQDR